MLHIHKDIPFDSFVVNDSGDSTKAIGATSLLIILGLCRSRATSAAAGPYHLPLKANRFEFNDPFGAHG
jgi:hypothetical protein